MSTKESTKKLKRPINSSDIGTLALALLILAAAIVGIAIPLLSK